ncbi:MAG TPA: metalloregulator ArsR/SmtB family transcription factor [Bacillota bacterium]|nr:metalloregulator ArsR/SmtB family transcription factor [Bacillota bacterium]
MNDLKFGLQTFDEKKLETIAAITEKTRLQIIFFLGINRRVCVNEIAANFKISRPAISHHLKILKNYGIVQSEKVGQETYYSFMRSNLVKMLRDMADSIEKCCQE